MAFKKSWKPEIFLPASNFCLPAYFHAQGERSHGKKFKTYFTKLSFWVAIPSPSSTFTR